MKILEISKSIQGELPHMGKPCTIVRLEGCNIQCPYCDVSKDFQLRDLTIEEILDEVMALGRREILLTGGEPLIHSGVKGLLQALYGQGFNILIETNGTVPLDAAICGNSDVVVMDVKLFDVGAMRAASHNLDWLSAEDAIKFVYRDALELRRAWEWMQQMQTKIECMVIFSPVNVLEPLVHLFDQIVDEFPDLDIRMQCQIHKVLGLS